MFNGGRFVIAAAAVPPPPDAALAPGQMPQRAKISAQHSWMHYPAALIYRRARARSFFLFNYVWDLTCFVWCMHTHTHTLAHAHLFIQMRLSCMQRVLTLMKNPVKTSARAPKVHRVCLSPFGFMSRVCI